MNWIYCYSLVINETIPMFRVYYANHEAYVGKQWERTIEFAKYIDPDDRHYQEYAEISEIDALIILSTLNGNIILYENLGISLK